MTVDKAKRAVQLMRRESKYHNRKTAADGIMFDSQKEANRYRQLRLLERAGEIRGLQLQVKYEVIPKTGKERATYYIADFVYEERKGGKWETVVEDCKGMKTDVYKLKKKLMRHVHGIEIQEV